MEKDKYIDLGDLVKWTKDDPYLILGIRTLRTRTKLLVHVEDARVVVQRISNLIVKQMGGY